MQRASVSLLKRHVKKPLPGGWLVFHCRAQQSRRLKQQQAREWQVHGSHSSARTAPVVKRSCESLRLCLLRVSHAQLHNRS